MLLLLLSLISVQDDQARIVHLEKPAQRIISLSPHLTEWIIALGAADRLIAVADFQSYPDKIKSVPRLSAWGALDREQIVLWQPDLILAWGSGQNRADLQWLSLHYPVFISEPRDLDQIIHTASRLGRLLGLEKKAAQLQNQMRQSIKQACPEPFHQSYYYDIWSHPLMSLGGRHWLNDVLAQAGLYNIWSDIPRGVFQISPEALLSRPLDWVLSSQIEWISPYLKRWPIIKIDPSLSRPGPSIVQGFNALCHSMRHRGAGG